MDYIISLEPAPTPEAPPRPEGLRELQDRVRTEAAVVEGGEEPRAPLHGLGPRCWHGKQEGPRPMSRVCSRPADGTKWP